MIVFKFNLRLWEVCGVYLPASSTMWNHFLSISSVLVILGGLTLFFWRSLAYILAEQNNLNTAKLFYPVMQIGAISTLFGPYVSAVFVRSSFSEMVKMLQQVVDKRMRRRRELLYRKVERKAYLLAKWLISLTVGMFAGTKVFTLIGYGIRDLLSGAAFDSKNYYDLLKFEPLVDRSTILGYMVYSVTELFIVLTYYCAYCCIISLFISPCWYVEAICMDFEQTCNEDDQATEGRIQRLIDAIAFQSNIHIIFDRLKSVSTAILLLTQLSGAVFISVSIFQVDAASQKFDTNFVMMLGVTTVAILAVFPTCYYASRISYNLNQTANVIYSTSWYSLPVQQQKYIPFMIAFAHRDHVFRGMNMISCSLESFVQILRASGSYYLMIKKL